MGLLSKAEAYLEWEAKQRIAAEQKMAAEQKVFELAASKRKANIKKAVTRAATIVKTAPKKLSHLVTDFSSKFNTAIKQAYQPKMRRYAAALLALGLGMQLAEPRNMDTRHLELQKLNYWNITPQVQVTVQTKPAQPEFGSFVDIFTKDVQKTKFSEQDRDDLARLLYGEAGHNLADAVEVLHTVLNRYASPLFKGNMHEIITAKNQYVGYNRNHPVDKKLRALVDYVIDEWEAHGCQAIDHCDHYYFRTGDAGICNQFEIAPAGSQGRWVKPAQKQFEEKGHYCPNANNQAVRFETYWRAINNTHTI